MGFEDSKEKLVAFSQEEMEARRVAREEYEKWVLIVEASWR